MPHAREEIAFRKRTIVGKRVANLEYDARDEYFTITFDDGSEFSFRFMADLMRPFPRHDRKTEEKEP